MNRSLVLVIEKTRTGRITRRRTWDDLHVDGPMRVEKTRRLSVNLVESIL
jgi:hypothetical protein